MTLLSELHPTWNRLARGTQHPRRYAIVESDKIGRWVCVTDQWVATYEFSLASPPEGLKSMGDLNATTVLQSVLKITEWRRVQRAALLGALAAHGSMVCDYTDDDRPESEFIMAGEVKLCGVSLSVMSVFPMLMQLEGVAELEIAPDHNPWLRRALPKICSEPEAPAGLALRLDSERVAIIMRSSRSGPSIDALVGLKGGAS